jgi:hypothetical protein
MNEISHNRIQRKFLPFFSFDVPLDDPVREIGLALDPVSDFLFPYELRDLGANGLEIAEGGLQDSPGCA